MTISEFRFDGHMATASLRIKNNGDRAICFLANYLDDQFPLLGSYLMIADRDDNVLARASSGYPSDNLLSKRFRIEPGSELALRTATDDYRNASLSDMGWVSAGIGVYACDAMAAYPVDVAGYEAMKRADAQGVPMDASLSTVQLLLSQRIRPPRRSVDVPAK